MSDYLPEQDINEVLGRILVEARKPKAKKPDVPFSKKQLELHYDDLYLGYIKKLSEVERRLKDANKKTANATYSDFRELKKEEAFALNAVWLHELYFSGLSKTKRNNYVDERLKKDFGSHANWENDFIACGLSARGWVVLGYDNQNDCIRHVITDEHSGGVWQLAPILVLDMYEHAMIDFNLNKGKYIEFIIEHIDWEVVSGRLVDCSE